MSEADKQMKLTTLVGLLCARATSKILSGWGTMGVTVLDERWVDFTEDL